MEFNEEINLDKILIENVTIDLPEIEDTNPNEQLQSLMGTQVLNPKERKKIQIEFDIEPHPSQVQGLSYFIVQIISEESGAVGTAKKVKVWKPRSLHKKVTLDKLEQVDFEDGWHFIRVRPWTEDSNPIPLQDCNVATKISHNRSNESERFYVVCDVELNDEPPQRSIPKDVSVEHAKLRLQFQAINNQNNPQDVVTKDVNWSSPKAQTKKTAEAKLEIKFGREGKRQILVPTFLKELEQQILNSPNFTFQWSLKINRDRPEKVVDRQVNLSPSTELDKFIDDRTNYFQAISQDSKQLISQAANFWEIKQIGFTYVQAYQDLLRQLQNKIEQSEGKDTQAFEDLKNILAIDTIKLTITNFRGQTKEALLLSPTHPLRALWWITWAATGREWLETTQINSKESIGDVREGILKKLFPLNFPLALPLSDRRFFVAVDNIHPFWSLYAPTSETDPRGLLGEICNALGVPELSSAGSSITGELIANRIERYLIQHPYISTLTINLFNPGQATLLAKSITLLQERSELKNLRYEIRLFVTDPEAFGVGEALEQLLSSSQIDNLSTSSGNHLFPKLNLAIKSINAFQKEPMAYQAHLAILIDLFPAQELGVAPPFYSQDNVPLHGLIQDFAISFQDDERRTFWQRQPRHGKTAQLKLDSSLTTLLAKLPQQISGAIAAVATGESAFDKQPTITLGLQLRQREIINNIHQACDWVFTIDRNLGIEFFDRGGTTEHSAYLVDHTPNSATSLGHQLVITSRSLLELKSLLAKVLQSYQLSYEPANLEALLEYLRSLSGRLALKLLSTPQHQAEVLGLALSRQFLQYQGALSNQIIIPLDAHTDLFRTVQQRAKESGEYGSLQRTDLALFDLNPITRTIVCNLVEVKCYKSLGGQDNLEKFNQLKDKIAEQIQQSEKVLRQHFEDSQRADRLLKINEFTTLLNFYLERSLRYQLINPDIAAEARGFLSSLEDGYQLDFTHSGLIFDFEQTGTESPDLEEGIEYHRIGFDLIENLIATAKITADFESTATATIPKLTTAAFLVLDRERAILSAELIDSKSNPDIKPVAQKDVSDSDPDTSSKNDKSVKASLIKVSKPAIIKEIAESPVDYDVLLGSQSSSPQYGILGDISGRKIALDLNQTHTISLFGVQGAGKSYTLGSIIEMACLPIPKINNLPSPLATIVFHYSPTQDYKPEFTSMNKPNREEQQLKLLRDRYGANPSALKDILILTSASEVETRQAEYPDIDVKPITFAASELKVTHWKFLMGALGSQSMYMRSFKGILKNLRENLTLGALREAIENSNLADNLKNLATSRLDFAADYIDDNSTLTDVIRPGRLIIVDVRDDFLEREEVLGLFVVLLQIFSEATYEGKLFNKLVVFDEAHKYMEDRDLVAGLTETVREMRHKGTSILIASQDPPSVPISLIELSSQIILHRFNSPAWLKHIQKANVALTSLTPEKMSNLTPGTAYIWSSKTTDGDSASSKEPIKMRCRPRVTQHGGSTKTAV